MKNEEQLGNNNPEATRCKTGIKWCRIVCTMVVSLVVVLSGTFVMRDGLININKNREYISVKGLAEKEVRSDFAIWMIPINATGDDLDLVRDKIELDVQKTVDYLKKYGIKDEEIEQDVMRIFDKTAQRYYDENNKAKRFAVDNQIVIKTANVDAVYKASKNINDILKDGVTLAYDGYSPTFYAPMYLFTKLNEIKPTMLSEAMQEAKKAAEHILAPSSEKVGKIRNASQGIFSIYSREAIASGPNFDQKAYGSSQQYSSNEVYFIEKVVRVLVSVDYYIK